MQRRRYKPEILKRGASGNLPRIRFRLHKNLNAAAKQVALQAWRRVRKGGRSKARAGFVTVTPLEKMQLLNLFIWNRMIPSHLDQTLVYKDIHVTTPYVS